jgi:putative transcriptional regulator
MAYHYTESGLDNVYLENGYTIHKTLYGDGVSIEHTDGLHRAIGRWLVDLPKPLNGAELRFLRLELELTQHRLADLVGSTEQNVRRWEKARTKPINGSADLLLRKLYQECIGGDGTLRAMVDRLADLDQIKAPTVCLRETETGWLVERHPAAA